MAEILIYSTPVCPYCERAKGLLKRKGADFKVIDVSADPAIREDMVKKAGGKQTVPQIFINGKHIGGSDDLHKLDSDGKLDALLAERH